MTSIKNTALAGLFALTAIGAVSSHAQAAFVTTNGPVGIYSLGSDTSASETNASFSRGPQFSVNYSGAINFNLDGTSSINTIYTFLTSGGGTVTPSNAKGLGTTLGASTPTLFDFTFVTGLDTNYAVTHDDGFSIYDGTTEVISGHEGPTAANTDIVSLMANKTYSLIYVESNGLPADLVVSNVPEPTTMALLGAGLISMGVVGRRRKSATTAA